MHAQIHNHTHTQTSACAVDWRNPYTQSIKWSQAMHFLKTVRSVEPYQVSQPLLHTVTMATGLVSSVRWAPEEGRTESPGCGRTCCHQVCSYTVAICAVSSRIFSVPDPCAGRVCMVPRRLCVLVPTCNTVIGRDKHSPWQFLPRQILQ